MLKNNLYYIKKYWGYFFLPFSSAFFTLILLFCIVDSLSILDFGSNLNLIPFLAIASLLLTISLVSKYNKNNGNNQYKNLLYILVLLILEFIIFYNFNLLPETFSIVVNYLSIILIFIFIIIFSLNQKKQKNETVFKNKTMKISFYIPLLISIVFLGFLLRINNIDYVQGADNFNLIAAKSLHENGFYTYNRNIDITYIVAFLFDNFGISLAVARAPIVFIGVISIVFIYLLGSLIDKRVGLLSAFLLAVSPVAIEQSVFLREYSTLLLISLVVSYFLICIYKKYESTPQLFIKYYLYACVSLAAFFYFYSYIVNTGTIKSALSIIFFISFPILFFFIKDNYPKHITKCTALMSFILVLFLFLIPIAITMFSFKITYTPYWFQMFFNPMTQTPMQWFSFSLFPTAFFVSTFLFSILSKNRIVLILHFVFWMSVVLFVFKYQNIGHYLHARYLYYLYPYYIILFSVSLFQLYSVVKSSNIKRTFYVISLIFIFSSFHFVSNTIHASKHDLTIWDHSSKRQPTSAGSRNFFIDVIKILKQNGVSNKDAIVIQGESPALITWYMDYPITRTYLNSAGNAYETGSKVYIVNRPLGINELDFALRKHSTGYLLWHSSFYEQKNFYYQGKLFTFLESSGSYKLYRWE